jgi:hypothetical protein
MFEDMQNKHRGQTCIIIGNGPSLRSVPNDFLDSVPTMGCNRIYLKYLPTYYVAINELLISQYRMEIQNVASTGTAFIRERTGIRNAYQLHLIETPMFSFAPTKWIYDGHNTTFVMLQLAFFLGFTNVLLVGVDHKYKFDGKPNETLFMKEDDPNHFHPHYFKGKQWQAPDLKVSEDAYRMAKEAYEQNNRRITNVTQGSALRVFKHEEVQWAV